METREAKHLTPILRADEGAGTQFCPTKVSHNHVPHSNVKALAKPGPAGFRRFGDQHRLLVPGAPFFQRPLKALLFQRLEGSLRTIAAQTCETTPTAIMV